MIAGRVRPQMLLAAWTFLLYLPLIFAQTTSPSNGTIPVDPKNTQLLMNSKYDVDPLTDQAGLSAGPDFLQVRTSCFEINLCRWLRLTFRAAN